MKQKREGWFGELVAVAAAGILVLSIPFGFVALGVWWLESRFGLGVAAVTLGGILAILAFVGGALFAYRLSKRTLENAAVFVEDVTGVQRATVSLLREGARAEREAFSLRARAELADEARVRRLADQQARLLVDGQVKAEPAPAPSWARRVYGAAVDVEAEEGNEEGGQWTRWS